MLWRIGADPDEIIWVSSSKHDNIEAFEFEAPVAGQYVVWRFAQEEDWQTCDRGISDWGGSGDDVYEFFIGEAQ